MIRFVGFILFFLLTFPIFRKASPLFVQHGEYYLAADDYAAAFKKDSLNPRANLEYGLLNTQYINNPGNAGVYLLRAEHRAKKTLYLNSLETECTLPIKESCSNQNGKITRGPPLY